MDVVTNMNRQSGVGIGGPAVFDRDALVGAVPRVGMIEHARHLDDLSDRKHVGIRPFRVEHDDQPLVVFRRTRKSSSTLNAQ